MGLFDGQKILVAFCSPHRTVRLPNGNVVVDPVPFEWHTARMAMSLGTNCNFVEFFCNGREVGRAREEVTRRVLAHVPRPEFVFWLDDDVIPDWDAFVKLLYRARCYPDHDVFAGVYSCKGLAEPLVYAGEGNGPFWDWAIGDLLTTDGHGVTACHSGLTLVRTSLYRRMIDAGVTDAEAGGDRPFYRTVKDAGRSDDGNLQSRTGTEDLYFAQQAKAVGVKFLIDTSVLAGHYDRNTGITWGLPENSPPVTRARWLGGKDRKEAEGATNGNGESAPVKLALDLGAGGTRREWPGHKTYTLDVRPESRPDYCQDTRQLNLPDNHFDLVASSHHLEHLGRWDQERVWAEMFRVLKPGGVSEHVVPSVEWAAARLVEDGGVPDDDVLNVLYGAQEAHGYARDWNTHYFGYTKAVARALAEQSGLVDVTCEDWRDRPELGYNLIVRGRKPAPISPRVPPAEEVTVVRTAGLAPADDWQASPVLLGTE